MNSINSQKKPKYFHLYSKTIMVNKCKLTDECTYFVYNFILTIPNTHIHISISLQCFVKATLYKKIFTKRNAINLL